MRDSSREPYGDYAFIRCSPPSPVAPSSPPSEIPTGENTVGDAGSVGDVVACSVPCRLGHAECKEGGSDHSLICWMMNQWIWVAYRFRCAGRLSTSVPPALVRIDKRQIVHRSAIYRTWLAQTSPGKSSSALTDSPV